MRANKFLQGLLRPFRRKQLDVEMTEEIESHLAMRTQANLAAGMQADEARREALRQFGHLDSIKERARDIRPGTRLELFNRDIVLAFRQLLKSPTFSLTVIGTLALGIAACTVIFTAIDVALLHPFDSPYAERVVVVHETRLPETPQMPVSWPMFLDLQRETKSFEFLTAWYGLSFTLTGETEPIALRVGAMSADFFHILNGQIALGRGLLPEDFAPGKANVVVLSSSFWRTSFGSSVSVIGRIIHLDNQPYTIVGVLSESFSRLGSENAMWCPLVVGPEASGPQARNRHFLGITGVLKSGVTVAQAQAELDVVAQQIQAQFPQSNRGVGLLVRYFNQYLNRSLRPLLLLLLGAVGAVLAIVCANVANLLLARASTRQREFAVRAALGASRTRLIRALLAESVLLSVIAGVIGVLLAQWGLRLLQTYGVSAGTDLARLAAVKLNPEVLLFTLGFSALTGICFGLAPAWFSSQTDLNDALKQGSRGATEGRGRGRFRRALVVMEIALALTLLTGAGMLVRRFSQIAALDPGFSPTHVATMEIRLRSKYVKSETRAAFADALIARLETLPNVQSAALSSTTPAGTPGSVTFGIENQGSQGGITPYAAVPQVVTPGYFQTMGVRLLRGQIFPANFAPNAPLQVVINQSLVKQCFPNDDPLGHRLQLNLAVGAPPTALEIVGIVADVMQGPPDQPREPQIYFPWSWANPLWYYTLVRTSTNPKTVLSSLKPQVYALDQDQAISMPRVMTDLMDDAFARQSLTLRLLTIFSAFAVFIAAIGIYGIIAYSVSQRTSEIGIRMALGALPSDIIRQFLRSGLTLVAIGLGFGLVLAIALGRVMQSVLFNSSPRDPLTFVVTTLILFAVAVLACLIPARRAARVDPFVALRAE